MLEDALRLPLSCVGEIKPDVHAPRSDQHGIDSSDVIRCGKKKPVR